MNHMILYMLSWKVQCLSLWIECKLRLSKSGQYSAMEWTGFLFGRQCMHGRKCYCLFTLVEGCVIKARDSNEIIRSRNLWWGWVKNGPILLLRSWIGSSAFWTGVRLKGYWSCTSAFTSKMIRHTKKSGYFSTDAIWRWNTGWKTEFGR